MSRNVKFIYFLVALCVMACFAAASVMMGENRPGLALVLFIVAIVLTGGGFMMKGKLMKR